MLELITTYGLEQAVIFIIMTLFAVKGGVDLFDWFKNKYQEKFDKDNSQLSRQQALEEHYRKCIDQHRETAELYNGVEEKIDNLTNTVNIKFDSLEKSIKQLTESDMHDIKGWIVEKHHILVAKGWVDDFTMDTLEKRYSDYVKENGNSYVKGLMDELRDLPHAPQ